MKIPILMYHSISDDNSNISISLENFEKQIKFLKQLNFETIEFDEIDKAKKNSLIITFDDGYKDNVTNALPILKKYNYKATCFVVSDLIGKSNVWDKNYKNYIYKELLSRNDILEWKKSGMKIGSHTKNHINITKIKNENINDEIITSKKVIEELIGCEINSFSYPYGKVNKITADKVSSIYKYAVTTVKSRFDLSKHNLNFIPRVHMSNDFSKLKIYLKMKTFYEDLKYNEKQLHM